MDRSKRLISFGVGIVVALLAVTFFMADNLTTTNAAGGGPEMALTVPAGGSCDGSGCTVPSGGDFTLAVEAVAIPDGGYILAQSFIVYGANLTYNASGAAADEITWPDCNESVAVRPMTAENAVGHGCLTGLIPPLAPSSYTGDLVEISMTCKADGANEVQLVPYGTAPAGTNGAQYKTADNTPITPKVSNLTVTCGTDGGETPVETTPVETTPMPTTPTATTPTATTPTNTPVTPTATTPPVGNCGDVNDDGNITSTDALWVLWYTAQLVDSLPNTGDINGDGMTDSRDATLILQYTADLLNSLHC